MKLTLEAIFPPEGIGFVRTEQTLRLVRPPYVLPECPVLAEDALRDAVLRHGFFAAQEEFSSWDEAIRYLNRQAVESRRASGKQIPESIPQSEVLELAPAEVLQGFLDRTETELIPQGHFDHAEDFLMKLLASKALADRPELSRRAAQLLERNKKARERSQAAMSDLAGRDLRFPSLEKHGQLKASVRLAELIREQHAVLAPVG